MKHHALMCKRTANLIEGVRVNFSDSDLMMKVHEGYSVYLSTGHDGWIVTAPSVAFGGFWIWMNRKWVEENFEDLGEI